MMLAPVQDPGSYQDLYVYDFGDWTAVGYTAAEIATLLEDPRYSGGKIFRICAARPDGTFELQGVSRTRFDLESGMFFYQPELGAARGDFDRLVELADATPLPCRAYVQLADRGSAARPHQFVTALVYPCEYDPQIGRWLLDQAYAGGELAEGGPSHVTNYLTDDKLILARRQFHGREQVPSRSADEVLASVRRAVQR